MKRHTRAIGIASGALILAVGIQLSGQSSGQAVPAPVKPSASAAAAAGKSGAPARAAARRTAAPPPSQGAFAAATKSLFEETCSECHHSEDPAGGLDVALYDSVDSLTTDRDRWELILTKLKAGEMPPEDVLRPDQRSRCW